jgi:hypothetical protein
MLNNGSLILTNEFLEIEETASEELKTIATEVLEISSSWRRQSQTVAVEIGGKLKVAREIFMKNNKGKLWQRWVETELVGEISHDTANNLINLYNLVLEHGEEHSKGISRLSLSALYNTARTTVEPEVKEEILKLAAASKEPPTREEITDLIKVYRKIKLAEAGVNPQVIDVLAESSVAEDAKELRNLSKLSAKRQIEVANLLVTDTNSGFKSTKEALLSIKKEKEKTQDEEIQKEKAALSTGGMKSKVYKGLAPTALNKVPYESVDVAVVEAPMRYSFIKDEEEGFIKLCGQLGNIIKPGGFGLITIGHKAAMFCGPIIEAGGLTPLHLLVLRRHTGRSRSIVGINITCASVIIALVYKPPYYAPRKMIVDLQTLDKEVEENQAPELVEGYDEIENGMEECLNRFLTPIVEVNNTVMHCVYGSAKEHFGIREALKNIASNCGASKFLEVG